MKKDSENQFEKYGVMIMAFALICVIIALPVLTHAGD
jgi:hypothetical protein